MAKTTIEVSAKSSQKRLAKLQRDLLPFQEKLRANPYDAELRELVQAKKREIAVVADEAGELARVRSKLAGGKQFQVPV